MHVVEAARMGCHIATVPYKVVKQMIRHPLTDAGITRFLEDWRKQVSKGPGSERGREKDGENSSRICSSDRRQHWLLPVGWDEAIRKRRMMLL